MRVLGFDPSGMSVFFAPFISQSLLLADGFGCFGSHYLFCTIVALMATYLITFDYLI